MKTFQNYKIHFLGYGHPGIKILDYQFCVNVPIYFKLSRILHNLNPGFFLQKYFMKVWQRMASPISGQCPFSTRPPLSSLNILENLWFSNIFRRYGKGILVWDGLMQNLKGFEDEFPQTNCLFQPDST